MKTKKTKNITVTIFLGLILGILFDLFICGDLWGRGDETVNWIVQELKLKKGMELARRRQEEADV